MSDSAGAGPGGRGGTLLVLTVAAVLAGTIAMALWRSPFPLSEAVALFEDVAQRPASSFLLPSSSYYRPLFHLNLWVLLHGAGSSDRALAVDKLLLHIGPLLVLTLGFVWYLRPQNVVAAASALAALTVLVGSPGLLGNLELPLSYTIVGMAATIPVWMLLERERRPWHGAAIVALVLLAIGFKEQGLVLVPVVIAAWWMGAPGIDRGTSVAVAAIAATYVNFRLTLGAPWPTFEQDVGVGFERLTSAAATERYGAAPLPIFAYNSFATIANVLFAEPTEGVFRFVAAIVRGTVQPWHLVYLLSSTVLTLVIVWWACTIRYGRYLAGASTEGRVAVALVLSLAACGLLSFDYSRDRLGGMAAPFYALAAYYAIRTVLFRAAGTRLVNAVAVTVLLTMLGGAWGLRALYTVEFTRQRALNAHREWLTDIGRRRIEFATRGTYLAVMQSMLPQGTARRPTSRTRYPRLLMRLMGED
jgi:hypothetical protein